MLLLLLPPGRACFQFVCCVVGLSAGLWKDYWLIFMKLALRVKHGTRKTALDFRGVWTPGAQGPSASDLLVNTRVHGNHVAGVCAGVVLHIYIYRPTDHVGSHQALKHMSLLLFIHVYMNISENIMNIWKWQLKNNVTDSGWLSLSILMRRSFYWPTVTNVPELKTMGGFNLYLARNDPALSKR